MFMFFKNKGNGKRKHTQKKENKLVHFTPNKAITLLKQNR